MSRGQIALLVAAVAVAAALYMLPYAPIAKESAMADEDASAHYSLTDDLTEANNGLDSASLALVMRYELAAEKGDPAYRDSLIALYDMLRSPVASSFHAQEKARQTGTAEAWTEAGERFLLCAKYMGDQTRKSAWFASSREAFEKAIALDPADLGIKVDYGVCLVEGAAFLGIAPMQGIGVLREVEQADPANIKALVNLGYFSVRSGQWDKAEERFLKVTEADPGYAEAHLYLADLYEKKQEPGKAAAQLRQFIAKEPDPRRRAEVESYLRDLEKK